MSDTPLTYGVALSFVMKVEMFFGTLYNKSPVAVTRSEIGSVQCIIHVDCTFINARRQNKMDVKMKAKQNINA